MWIKKTISTLLLKLDKQLFSADEMAGRRAWHERLLSVLLLYLFVSTLLYLSRPWNPTYCPSPGVAVAILAVAAAFMALLGVMGGREKVAWILLLFAYLADELYSIKRERVAQEQMQAAAHSEQIKNFNEIGNGITASIERNEANFNKTIGRTNEVLRNITGGDSFAYVAPQYYSGDQFPGVV
jgi:hypothetical protein